MPKPDFTLDQDILLIPRKGELREFNGLCMAMTYDWVKRKLSNLKIADSIYEQPSHFMSFQRALKASAQWKAQKDKAGAPGYFDFVVQAGLGDKLLIRDDFAKAQVTTLGAAIDALKPGTYDCRLFNATWAHVAGIHIANDNSKIFFDVNIGQYSKVTGKDIQTLVQTEYRNTPNLWFVFRKYDGEPRDKAWLASNPKL
jgi:hypothetical protein